MTEPPSFDQPVEQQLLVVDCETISE